MLSRRMILCALVSCMALLLALRLAAQAPASPNVQAIQKATEAFRAGYAARQAGNLELAQAQFAEAVRLAPQIPEGHQALGTVLMERDKPEEAVAEFQAAARLKPGDAGIETDLALALAQAGQSASAIPHFDRALQRSQEPGQRPVDAVFHESYARALAAAGRPEQAIDQFAAAEALAGPSADLDDDLGSLYAQMSQWDQASSRFEAAIALDSGFVRARIHLAILLRQQHDVVGALTDLESAFQIAPSNGDVLLEYGRALAAAGRDDDAVEKLVAAVKANPQLPGVQLELAMALQRLGRQQEAIPWFQQALDRDPRNTSALDNLGLALTLTGKAKEALNIFERALAQDPDNEGTYKNMGVAHIQLSEFDQSIGDFEKALALDPKDAELFYDLGVADKFLDRFDDAIAALSRAAQLNPSLPDPPYTLGILYMQTGKLDEAIVQLKKAAALRPESGDTWAILGSTLKQDSRLNEAADALQKAIPLLPNQPGPRVTLAGVFAEQAATLAQQAGAADAAGDQQKAEQLRSQMKELRSQAVEYRRQAADLSRAAVSRQRADFALNAGNQLMLRGEIADAISRYQESIAADPAFAEPHLQLALAYERQGRTQDAAAERAKAKDLAAAQ